jgi:hypothetical protein
MPRQWGQRAPGRRDALALGMTEGFAEMRRALDWESFCLQRRPADAATKDICTNSFHRGRGKERGRFCSPPGDLNPP